MNIEALIQEFGDCVAAQSRCIEEGDAKTGNAYAERYAAAFDQLRKYGNAGRNALAMLMDDGRADVRVMAAAFLLRHSEEKALSVLRREAQAPGLVGFGAEQALERWKDGTWSLDPED